MTLFNTYGKLNIGGFRPVYILLIFAVGNGSIGISFYLMPLFFYHHFEGNFSAGKRTVFVISALRYPVYIAVISALRRPMAWKMHMIQYGSAPVNFLLLAGLTYFVVRAARDAGHIKFALLRRHTGRLSAGYCLTLLYACLDISTAFYPRVAQLYSFPAVYTVWSLVLLIYGMAYYLKSPFLITMQV